MTRNRLALLTGAATFALAAQPIVAAAQGAPENLGSVRVPRQVFANGQPLPAGTYLLRLTSEKPEPVIGSADEQWVEFLQNGQVKGRELAIVASTSEVKEIAESAVPGPGKTLVQVMKSGDYLRVWMNRGGTNYLVYLATSGG